MEARLCVGDNQNVSFRRRFRSFACEAIAHHIGTKKAVNVFM